jgi:uncharacterized membrane protein YkvA (DUF1232 family)
MALHIVLSVAASLIVVWLAFAIALVAVKPEGSTLRDAARILPDTVRLVHRLARDKSLGGGVRLRLWLLLAYLASPIDVIPDFIPLIGYADDVIITSVVLRTVIKRAGSESVRDHWPGTPDELAVLSRLCRLQQPETSGLLGAPTSRARNRTELLRSGFVLEGVTLGWNVVGIFVLAFAAIAARSVALGGFGLDSLIEIGASTVVIWELRGVGTERQRTALRTIGVAFVLLAVYLAVQSTYVLATASHPKHSVVGIVWTAATAVVMLGLALGKARVGRELDNPVLRTEGRVTLIDALLATAVLIGLTLNATLHWWWADPLAGYVILFYGLKEGREALRA